MNTPPHFSRFDVLLALAVLLVATLLYHPLFVLVGPGLPPYVIFYPVVMFVAIRCTVWVACVTTVLAALIAAYLYLPPTGSFGVLTFADLVGLLIFTGMGIAISLVAARSRDAQWRALQLHAQLAAQQDIARMNATLEQRVRDRTAQLEAAKEELQTISYTIAHDLRTPLRGIDGFSRIIQQDYADCLDARGQDYLSRIRAAAQLMGQLNDDVLRLLHVMRAEIRAQQVHLSDVARQTLEALQRRDPARRVRWEIMPHLTVTGDPSLLRLVMENLLENAWKFTVGRNEAHIVVGEQQQDDTRIIYIRDNGIGFEKTSVEKLFKPFQRLHGAEEFSGTGIGLAIVQHIINRHGGRVWAEGAVGEGATFAFTLPERR